MDNYLLAFVPIFVAVDALGIIPVYIALTGGLRERDKRVLVMNSTLTALCVAILFLFVGKLVFGWLGITMQDFLVAGGTTLFVISIRDILTLGKSTRIAGDTIGVVPLAVPLMVGPAVLATSLILLDAYGFYPTVFAIVANVVLCGAVLLGADRLSRLLGKAGSDTLSKISSLLLGAIGIMMVRKGVFEMMSEWARR